MTFNFIAGKLVQSVTSITLADNTPKTEDLTVPSGKRWLLLNIRLSNPDSVARSITIIKFKESAKTNIVKQFFNASVANGAGINIPVNPLIDDATKGTNKGLLQAINYPEICDAGNVISITWAAGGASAGGTDADGLVIEYLEIDI